MLSSNETACSCRDGRPLIPSDKHNCSVERMSKGRALTIRRDNVYVWVTWLSRLLVGDASCEWASWYKVHHKGYAKASRDFSLSTWKMHHTRLLNDARDRLEAAGHTVSTERENSFRLQGGSGALVSGQAHLISVAPDGPRLSRARG